MVMTQSAKLGLVRLAYSAMLLTVPSPADQAFWANQIADDGSNVDAILAAMEASAGPTSIRAQMAQLLADVQAGSFPGGSGTVAAHTHPVSTTGTTGPAA